MKSKRVMSVKSSGLTIPMLIGLAAYAAIIRFKGLWPMDVDWLLPQWNGNIDSASHYIGWEMYRQSGIFQWPIGRSPMLGPDGGSSIAYSTLPLLALIFKPLTHWSKIPLQFFGLWSLSCFLGQAVSAWKLLGIWIKGRIHLSLGVCFFVISPAFLDRLSVHFDASAHWLLIFALYLYFKPVFKFGQWLILGVLSVLIFPYLAMMVSIIFATRLVVDGISANRWFEAIKRISVYIGALLITAWQCGFFLLGGSKIDAEGYGIFSANVLTFVDPGFPENYRMPWSNIVPDRWQGAGQYEGFAFIGSGILFLTIVIWIKRLIQGSNLSRALLICPVILAAALFGHDHDTAQMKLTILLGIIFAVAFENLMLSGQRKFTLKLALCLSTVGMSLFAFSNQIMLGQFQIAHFDLNRSLLDLANTFRSSGRFVWPLMIVLIALIIIKFIGELPQAFVTPILIAALVFQVVDSNVGTQFTTDAYSRAGPDTYLTSDTWNLLGKKYDGVLFAPAMQQPRLFVSINADFLAENGVLWRDIGVLAQKYDWSMNSSYFSRDPENKFQKDNKALDLALVDGSFDMNMIYIFIGDQQWERAKEVARPEDLVGILNGVPIFAPHFYPCSDCVLVDFVDRKTNK
ncbi:MAG: DUF6311 domain-containing protein [Gammaproteobacteria bacterium]